MKGGSHGSRDFDLLAQGRRDPLASMKGGPEEP